MKEILLKYLGESNQSNYKFEKRISVTTSRQNLAFIMTYNRIPTIPVFQKMYKCMCEDGFVKYADELKEIYINKLRERHKELLEFMEEK